jgi:hypothetical protein
MPQYYVFEMCIAEGQRLCMDSQEINKTMIVNPTYVRSWAGYRVAYAVAKYLQNLTSKMCMTRSVPKKAMNRKLLYNPDMVITNSS